MKPSPARDRILSEAFQEDGVVTDLRMGDDPGPERMQRIIHDLREVFDGLNGAAAIDRELAHALFVLAVQIEAQLTSWAMQGLVWRDALFTEEYPAILLAVESIFAGEWQT